MGASVGSDEFHRRVAELLREIEWAIVGNKCPCCPAARHQGHHEDCNLADVLRMATGGMQKCEMCEDGQVWTECCDGSKGCACEGKQVLFGQCRVCNGTGRQHENADTQANITAIRKYAEATSGYLGNPHGRLR